MLRLLRINCLKKLPSREDAAKWKSAQPCVSERKLVQSSANDEKLMETVLLTLSTSDHELSLDIILWINSLKLCDPMC